MAEEYHTQDRNPSPCWPENRGASCDIEVRGTEGAAPTLDLADLLCGPAGNRSGLRHIGDKWVGECPLPDCQVKVPSFAVWPSTDSWHCFYCMRGGGTTDLARLAGDNMVAKARGR